MPPFGEGDGSLHADGVAMAAYAAPAYLEHFIGVDSARISMLSRR
jgi:hypothetical protein